MTKDKIIVCVVHALRFPNEILFRFAAESWNRARRDSISIKSIERRDGLKSPIDKYSESARSGSLIIGKVQAYRVDGDSISR